MRICLLSNPDELLLVRGDPNFQKQNALRFIRNLLMIGFALHYFAFEPPYVITRVAAHRTVIARPLQSEGCCNRRDTLTLVYLVSVGLG